MSLKENLSTELKIAMKESNTDSKRVIRMVIASVKNNEIDKGKLLNDDEVISIIHKEIKSRNEVIEGATLSNRQDLINEAENDIKILKRFLPEGLSHEELKKIIQETIMEVNAISISDMGKVMKLVIPKIGGRASGNEISQMVRELLNR